MKIYNLALVCLAVLSICCIGSVSGSDDIDKRVAMCLKHRAGLHGAKKTCDCGGDPLLCTCGPACGCANCPLHNPKVKSPGPLEWAIYQAEHNRAVAQNKPLIIWVGETSPICEQRWSQYLHARLSEYDGQGWSTNGPEVIVARPDGFGGMTLAGRLDGIPLLSQVQAALSGQRKEVQAQPNFFPASTVPIMPQYQPMSFMPAMPMMGGFGGGFGGGGGGGC